MQWLEDDFLQYWKEWENSIAKHWPNLTPSDKQLMQISHTTLEGMTMTGTSIFVYALMVN